MAADDDKKPDPKKEDDALGDAGKKALDEERKARRDAEKALRDAEARIKDLEDKGKTAEQQVAEKLAGLEKRADEADARALRAEVAQAKGLNAAQAKRLAGTTREELEADADDLLASFKPVDDDGEKDKKETTRPARRPTETLKGGTDPGGDTAVETNPAKLAESVPRF